MRAFSEFEKSIIKRMIELDENSGSLNVLGNVYDSFSKELSLPDYCYIRVVSEIDVTLQVKKKLIDKSSIDLKSFDDEVSKMLLTTVKLFEYLEEHGLAYYLGDLDFKSLGQVWSDVEYETCNFLEAESKALIYKFTRKKIYLTETLRDLVENNFKSEEEIRHEKNQESIKKQLKRTQIALILTFVGLLASIFLPMLSTTDINIKNSSIVTSLDVETLKSFRHNSELISEKIKSLEKEISHINVSIKNKKYKKLDNINQQLIKINSQIEIISNNFKLNTKTSNKGVK